MSTPSNAWANPRAFELMKLLLGRGKSSSEVARTLSEEFGRPYSRNAIISKAARTGTELAYSGYGKTKIGGKPRVRGVGATRARRAAAQIARRSPTPVEYDGRDGATTDNDVATISLFDLKAGLCHWPVGDPRSSSFGYCGKDTEEGHEYCNKHRFLGKYAASRDKGVFGNRKSGRLYTSTGVSP